MNPGVEVLSLENIAREAFGLPPRRADFPRVQIGVAAGDDAVYTASIVARKVAEVLEERGLVRAEKRESKAEPPRPARPSYVPGLAKAAEEARRTARDAEAVLEGQGRWVAVRVPLELRAACEDIVGDVLAALGRVSKHAYDRPNIVFVRPARAGEAGQVYTLSPRLRGFYNPKYDEVYVNVEAARDSNELMKTLVHEAAHAAGASEQVAARLAGALVKGGR